MADDAEEGRRRARRVAQVAQDLRPRYAPERASLEAFAVYHQAQRPVLDRLRGLAAELPALAADGRGLIFYGLVGTGKDHLLAAMLYAAAAQGVECRWRNGQEVYGQFRDRMDTGQREEELLEQLAAPQVLAISDPVPPVGQPSAWNVAQLYRLLDRRYRDLKSTWVSLNAASAEDADRKLSAPVFDRLREGAEMFACFWPSWRERRRQCGP